MGRTLILVASATLVLATLGCQTPPSRNSLPIQQALEADAAERGDDRGGNLGYMFLAPIDYLLLPFTLTYDALCPYEEPCPEGPDHDPATCERCQGKKKDKCKRCGHGKKGCKKKGHDHKRDGHKCEGHKCEGHKCEGHKCDGHECDGHKCEGHKKKDPREGACDKCGCQSKACSKEEGQRQCCGSCKATQDTAMPESVK